ncbi:MAG: hypothetical protein IJW29_03885 [Clostridia bacterium]|nr:hypothetical protein [Clostridia bacterium]
MLALLDARAPKECAAWLARIGHTPLCLPPHPALPAPIASHPDMLLFFAPDAILCTESYARLAQKELEVISRAARRPICAIAAEYGAQYPHDVLFNAARVGNRLFCLPRATAARILEIPNQAICPVRQGYAKCSVIPVGENALMTADDSIERAARAANMDVLRLSKGHIRLDGYDYGFPGGAASCAPYGGTDEILFCGDLSVHPDALQMRDFCAAHGYRLCDCKDFPPTDVGTIFLI